jgi:hypothetical protein
MKKIYASTVVLLTLCSCGPKINYLGNHYRPTEKVDVFVDESAIKKSYDIVGKGYVKSYYLTRPEQVQTKAVETARQKGADAVLIKDYFIPVTHTGLQTILHTDSSGRGVIATGNSSMTQSLGSEFMVLFLKYN